MARRKLLRISLTFIFFLAGCEISASLPHDDELIQNYLRHESDFGRLVAMSDEDSHLVRIDPDFTRLDTDWTWPRKDIGISTDRWNEYRRLFQELGLQHGIERDVIQGQTLVFFLARTTGTSLAESQKGFVHVSDLPEPKPILNSLDGNLPPEAAVKLADGTGDRSQAYRRIKINWYLYRLED